MYHYENEDGSHDAFISNEEAKYIPQFLQGIIEHLYGKEDLDESDLHFCMLQLCAIAGIELPPKAELNIQRRVKAMPPSLVNSWLDFNRRHNKSLLRAAAVGVSKNV